MEFIGRKKEITKIERLIKTDNMSTILVYGRRRVGKSELVKQILKRNAIKSIYYECKQVAEASNAKGIAAILSETFNLPKLGYNTIEEILEYIFKFAEQQKMILVLDEYPYLRQNVKGMDSILQSLIDKYRDTAQIKVFVLGSYVDTMKSLLQHANPLFGRIDLTLHLQQMDYYESSLFYPDFSDEDKVRLYSVFGGIPYYNRLIDPSKSVQDNIIELIASDNARLENEISMYLQGEIGKIINTNEVFEALARGFSKFSDILSQSHVSSSPTLVDVLDKLVQMEVVEKVTPINDPNNRRKAGYYICDNLSLFYYKYIFRYASQLKIMDAEVFYNKYISTDFETDFVPHQFERIAKQYVIRQNMAGKLEPVVERIGKYYYDNPSARKNGEFDLVTQDEKGYVFYEVKFRKHPVTDSMIQDEIAQVKATGLNCYKYVFISRSGFAVSDDEYVQKISLQDFFVQ